METNHNREKSVVDKIQENFKRIRIMLGNDDVSTKDLQQGND